MPCHGCATNFSFFTKEQNCPNCMFSFCSKCLKEKINVNDKNQKVCNNCYKQLTNKTSSTSVHQFEPPALLLKRLETLDNPAKPPITIIKNKRKLSNLKANLDPEDREIYERLEKLRESRRVQEPPSETEIKRRLLILKGMDENTEEKPQVLQAPRKTEQEEVDDLLKQYMDETIIEGNISQENKMNLEGLEGRLKNLSTSDIPPSENRPSNSFECDDEDSVTRRIVEKTLAEARLEKSLEDSGMKSDSDDDNISTGSDKQESELPWCIICNEDAVLRCLGCDRSLYCETCFKQGHEFFEMEDHQTIKVVKEELSE